PILVDGYIYTYSGTTLYKVDTVSGNIVATGTMDHASSFAINPPTYADGMIFVGLADGTVQAFNASTLESLWIYKDKLQGQPNSSIVYHDGYIYTGFWVGETNNANYVCISATDEDPTQAKEEKLATWSYTSKGGFYWSGAYVCDDYLLVGTDDGESGYTSGKAKLLSFSTKDGRLIDEAEMEVVGDIRSSITEYDGKYYFTNKGGYFFEAEVNLDGTIKSVKKLKLSNGSNNDLTPAMSTCTPTIYNDRAYVGVSGSSQFGSYTGHNITVIDIKNWEIAYSVATQGYPQTSGVLTTAYEETTGNVYVYFFENYTPGKLRVLEDKPGQTSASITSVESYTNNGVTKNYTTVYNLFEPYGEQAQYSICSPIIDENGTIYFKNDSAYLMAVGSTIDKLEITVQPEKMVYKEGEFFDATGMAVTAYYTNGLSCDVTEYVTWSQDPLTVDDTDFNIVFPYYMYQNNNGETGVSCIEPFDVISITVEPISDVVYGDADNDENINMSDVIIVLKYINGE
ncbi:MAG: PQQ-binding-like beta-propeller repeat protein, partial [Oscillospiraceae bacterium]|nr:PQQ-binding-like beta-propeller repeat protein [Oscillospiraceae bacterium]